ncbi:TPA: hypothetical protein QB286_002051 [Pasteurella multocida]|uniref:hypothetical protein n=1 Tax=Pasteurella multocida TaxID=747 RepID=UPI0007445521|nr:hypothetical protein [Pasteurella multocida]KUM15377.1 hypothetical protein ASV60_09875 [Pasteurella multocida]HDR1007794.1 hypothetical protein [Pasteurella multocida]HDR1059063.1 hypothetical protein [Pasteurella multocida]HDR1190764.1 hypothetical protein [Pasteurella multocida]HDR1193274.1 hypothetical protein [Pasteurella multocida]
MKQIVLKTSLLMTLSSLLVACSGGGGSAGNRADQAQPVQLPQIVIPPQKTSLANKQQIQIPTTKNSFKHIEEEKMIKDTTNDWFKSCVSSYQNTCSAESKDTIKIYNLKTEENDTGIGPRNKTTEHSQIITLQVGDNNGDNYHFTLLDNNSMYYGYRQRANSDETGIHYDLIYTIENQALIGDIPRNYTATYKKNHGFIYTPYNLSSISENNILKKGNVEIYYRDGNVTGDVYHPDNQTNAIFKITGSGNQLTIASTKNIRDSDTSIEPNEKAVMDVKFIHSTQDIKDYKYIVGTSKTVGDPSKTGWSALLFAEKQ